MICAKGCILGICRMLAGIRRILAGGFAMGKYFLLCTVFFKQLTRALTLASEQSYRHCLNVEIMEGYTFHTLHLANITDRINTKGSI